MNVFKFFDLIDLRIEMWVTTVIGIGIFSGANTSEHPQRAVRVPIAHQRGERRGSYHYGPISLIIIIIALNLINGIHFIAKVHAFILEVSETCPSYELYGLFTLTKNVIVSVSTHFHQKVVS